MIKINHNTTDIPKGRFFEKHIWPNGRFCLHCGYEKSYHLLGFLARLIVWKAGHAIRKMMELWATDLAPLNGIIEMDEKFFGGKPRHQYGVRHKTGKATQKQSILVTVQRQGAAHPVAMEPVKTATILPVIDQLTDPQSQATLMTDKNYVFHQTGRQFLSHQPVYHVAKEYARGDMSTPPSHSELCWSAPKTAFFII